MVDGKAAEQGLLETRGEDEEEECEKEEGDERGGEEEEEGEERIGGDEEVEIPVKMAPMKNQRGGMNQRRLRGEAEMNRGEVGGQDREKFK
jgi:hypothetical protein